MLKKINLPIALLAVGLLIAMVIPMVLFPDGSAAVISNFYSAMTLNFPWLFLIIAFLSAVFAVFIMFSKYGDIRLGGPEAKPHYKLFTWISMNMCSAAGAGILIFGMVEWMYYVKTPPFGVKPMSVQAYEYASAYGMFHWGFSAWAIYLPVSLALGYIYWNKKMDSLNLSDLCKNVLKGDSLLVKIIRICIDGVVAFGYIGGLVCTIGLGTSILAELAGYLLNMPVTFGLRISIILVFCVFFILSTSKSIAKGVGIISGFNVKLAIAFFVFVFLVGPKSFILNNFTMAIGTNIREFVHMSFNTDSIAKTGFVQQWTIFYWAWYVGCTISDGLWLARVSYGRTFREIAIVRCIWTSLSCWVAFAVLGNYGMSLELSGKLNLSQMVIDSGNNAAVLAVLKTLPLSGAAIAVYMAVVFITLACGATAASTVVSILTSKNLKNDEEPNKWYKVFWAFLVLLLPVSILFLEHMVPGLNVLTTIQSVTSVFAIPMLFVIALLLVSFYKILKKDIESKDIPVDKNKLFKWNE
ncbi:BCCT transporter [Clostridium carboxidivorans P7]|uniref:BCCT transporter n=1 Tax=Clostridium carboxidivorans P7 TaxID=536227 RepID=C6Q114_9CLOT|nr:BCCT family transporter [Clostridium carboxidivorans]AKN32894.1 BCCT transporter [Clostridium carboxidivorans P7]EET84808.1 BCCT transporter [Clostridium carboxidivorans P7]EFG89858.1 BCCT family transporter [Clostridium carboxidivorans P7]